MRIAFVDTPPLLDWKPDSKYTKGGRRFPSLSVTGEKTYNYLVLQSISVLREKQGQKDVHFIDAQVRMFDTGKLIEVLADLKPDIVVIYAEQIKINVDLHVVRELKKRIKTYAVFTGPLVTALDRRFLDNFPEIDCICRGEFDYIIGEIADALAKQSPVCGISGVTVREGGTVVQSGPARHVENLDDLPFPAYDMIDFNDYTESVFVALPTATMITSRGCPYQCIYCWFPQTIYTHKWRSQSPRRVVDEMEYLVNKFNVRELRIDDDMFEVDRKRVIDICNLMMERGIRVPYAPQCRPDYIDDELLSILKKSGCNRVLLGIESGSQMILDNIKKNITLPQIENAVRLLKKHKIDIHNCFTFGFPWDTPETIRQTIEFACRLNSEFCQFSIATPLPGTEYYRMVKEKGFLLTEDFSQYDGFSKAVVKYENLTAQEIGALEIEAYRRYFLRFGYLLMMFVRMFRSKSHFMQTMRFGRAFWRRKLAGWI
jgi:radical SAM superfamily enzyme YgiQ (UPF0313 family)